MSSSYAVFTYAADPARGIELPIGIALWSPDMKFAQIRLVERDEKLNHFKAHTDLPFVSLVRDKVASWMEEGKLPYYAESASPWENKWWSHARKLLIHRTKLSEPRPVDCADPANDIEMLYESVVAPYRPTVERSRRVDGEISRCLNSLAHKFTARKTLLGVGERPVTVTRAYEGPNATVVVEGLNLAANPDTNSDLALGRLMRVKDGAARNCEIMIGYITSPGGLNGEGVLVDHICERTGAKAFDLLRDKSGFYAEANKLVAQADGRHDLFSEEE